MKWSVKMQERNALLILTELPAVRSSIQEVNGMFLNSSVKQQCQQISVSNKMKFQRKWKIHKAEQLRYNLLLAASLFMNEKEEVHPRFGFNLSGFIWPIWTTQRDFIWPTSIVPWSQHFTQRLGGKCYQCII